VTYTWVLNEILEDGVADTVVDTIDMSEDTVDNVEDIPEDSVGRKVHSDLNSSAFDCHRLLNLSYPIVYFLYLLIMTLGLSLLHLS
jgi:hypothetical protein